MKKIIFILFIIISTGANAGANAKRKFEECRFANNKASIFFGNLEYRIGNEDLNYKEFVWWVHESDKQCKKVDLSKLTKEQADEVKTILEQNRMVLENMRKHQK